MSTVVKAIVAVCDDWGIGLDGDMVVANREDMRHFVSCTMGAPVIMGRKTLFSFPGHKPLKGRRNIVLTRDPEFSAEGVEVAHSMNEALRLVSDADEAWVIGGGEVYRQFLPVCSECVVTKNHTIRTCDAYFPDLDVDDEWRFERQGETRVIADGRGDDGVAFDFCTYVRVAE